MVSELTVMGAAETSSGPTGWVGSESHGRCPDDITETIAEARDLAATQASLRRLALLVAEGAAPETVFAAVTHEALRHFGGGTARMLRFETDGTATILANEGTWGPHIQVGQALRECPPGGLTATILRTGRAARVEDYGTLAGGEPYTREGLHSAVGMPIHVHGRLWGMIAVGSASPDLPLDAERRMADFTELIAIAVANAHSRAELLASRARIIAASDAARRRVERDLHDGAQQRLVGLALRLRMATDSTTVSGEPIRREFDALVTEVVEIIEDLREISRGIHPAILSNAGVGAAVRTLARRSTVRVQTDIHLERRLPTAIEVCAYYVVSEALTNTAKHARASLAHVKIEIDGRRLRITVSDDGIGGADPDRGSGLVGINDRVQALGGTLSVSSHLGSGTRVSCELPTDTIDAMGTVY
jgi:signal transduction histidine kinase